MCLDVSKGNSPTCPASSTAAIPSSPAPDLCFVNKSCRKSARAFNTLPPQVFHDTVPRNGSPFSSPCVAPAPSPKTVLPRERKRVKILRELDLLDGTQEESFDRITNLASRIFRVNTISSCHSLRSLILAYNLFGL